MKTKRKTKFWITIVLSTAAGLAWLALIYALHFPEVAALFATTG